MGKIKDLEIEIDESDKKVVLENWQSIYNEDIEIGCKCKEELKELIKAVNRLCDVLEKKGDE